MDFLKVMSFNLVLSAFFLVSCARVEISQEKSSSLSYLEFSQGQENQKEFHEKEKAQEKDQELELEFVKQKPGETLIIKNGYSFVYEPKKRVAKWAAYHLSRDKIASLGKVKRDKNIENSCFKKDPEIINSPHEKSYYKTRFDRGHLVPAYDMSWSYESMCDSFYMSNMTPQNEYNNRSGPWKRLEQKLQDRAKSLDDIYVVVGPILTVPCEKEIGDSICVPKKHFKAILEKKDETFTAVAFIIDQKARGDLSQFTVPIDVLEKEADLDFFSSLSPEVQAGVESSITSQNWWGKDLTLAKKKSEKKKVNKKRRPANQKRNSRPQGKK